MIPLIPELPRPNDERLLEVNERWRQERIAAQRAEVYPSEWNVRFVAPDHWMHRVFSMAAARPGPAQHWMWSIVQVLFELALIAQMVGAFAAMMML